MQWSGDSQNVEILACQNTLTTSIGITPQQRELEPAQLSIF